MLSALFLALAIILSIIAAYQWTGLARYFGARMWTTACAAVLWLTWLLV
jgi:hypothetical protein